MSDAVELKSWYATPLGHTAALILNRRIEDMWPDVQGLSVAGVGYAPPVLDWLKGDAAPAVAIMLARSGAVAWPRTGPKKVVLAEEDALPFADASIDRIIVIHALEHVRHVRSFLREIWRVLTPGGKVMIITANRRSVWARAESTPFAQGRPYSASQLKKVLEDTLFCPVRAAGALYLPPLRARWARRAQLWADGVFSSMPASFGGVVMVEAEKELYAALPARKRGKALKPVIVGVGD